MYYVCTNLVKPLTEPYQLSFVELVGPSKMQWFVSHYWGMPLRHFGDAIRNTPRVTHKTGAIRHTGFAPSVTASGM